MWVVFWEEDWKFKIKVTCLVRHVEFVFEYKLLGCAGVGVVRRYEFLRSVPDDRCM